MCASSVSGRALCTLLYRTIERTPVQCLYFKSRMSKSKCKSSSDVAGSAKKCQELESQGKDKERQQEEVTEELKRFMMQEMARGFSLFETRLVFEAKNPSVEWYTQTFRMQSVLLCHLWWEKKKSYYPNITGEGNGNPLQYSCLENPMDRGAWQATIHGGARVRHDLVTKPPPPPPRYHWIIFFQRVDRI